MGWEAKCKAVIDGRRVEGRLQLETDRLYFRSPTVKLNLATKDLKIKAIDSVLIVAVGKMRHTFELGEAAQKWAHRIQNPKSLIEKLGVKADDTIIVVGRRDEEVVGELKKAGAKVSARKSRSDHDWIFVGVEKPGDIKLLDGLSRLIKASGGVWIIFPKGRPDLKDYDVIAGAKTNGLVGTKVARISDRLTGMKFVIPVKQRK